ncbi:hypothetical protein I6N90_18290 [Paenibacillus sp. GSMTC-2017]|nr:hypothetical protein [Paenibacillus sp. GSMTC-2017]
MAKSGLMAEFGWYRGANASSLSRGRGVFLLPGTILSFNLIQPNTHEK